MRPEDITKEHIRLASNIAGRAFRRLPAHSVARYEDVRSDALMGLVLAARSYDPSRGTAFTTHATFRIQGAILDGLRDRDQMSRDQRRKHTRATAARQQFVVREQRFPTTKEWAEVAGLEPGELGHLLQGDAAPLSFNLPNGTSDNLTIADRIPDDHDPIAETEIHSDMAERMGCLNSREHVVIWLTYWEGLKLQEIGEIIGVSSSRISQIKAEALTKMRAELKTAA